MRCCGHSNLIIFNQISSKFHIWIASIKSWFKFEYEICLTNDNQDGQQNGHRLSVYIHSLLWSLLLSHFLIPFLSNFIYGLLSSDPGSSSNMSCVRQTIAKMADKMATTYQFASLRCCGHSNFVIFLQISSNIHIWIASITLWF